VRRRVRVVKPGWVKRGRQRAHFPVNHLIGHDFSSGRSEQYAIPVVAERGEDAGDRSLADQRLIVRAAGANASPCGQFRRISQGWHERGGAGAELGDGVAVDQARAAGVYVATLVAQVVLQPVTLRLRVKAGFDSAVVALNARAVCVQVVNALAPGAELTVAALENALAFRKAFAGSIEKSLEKLKEGSQGGPGCDHPKKPEDRDRCETQAEPQHGAGRIYGQRLGQLCLLVLTGVATYFAALFAMGLRPSMFARRAG
jgi:hypothetical protein